MAALPDRVKEIIDTPVFAHVATVGPDGHPQNTVMWIDRDADRLLLNTAATGTRSSTGWQKSTSVWTSTPTARWVRSG
jgi:hypothetical protein